jgi:hypothetical protein
MAPQPDRVTCECGEPMEGELPIPADPAQRKPCPKCGSTSRMQGMAGLLQGKGSTIAMVTLIPYAETLLDKSKELIQRGEFNIATVVAHMACEIAVERAISRAVADRRPLSMSSLGA